MHHSGKKMYLQIYRLNIVKIEIDIVINAMINMNMIKSKEFVLKLILQI